MDSCCFDSGCPLLMNLEHPINFVDEWISNWLTKLGLIPHTHTNKNTHAHTHKWKIQQLFWSFNQLNQPSSLAMNPPIVSCNNCNSNNNNKGRGRRRRRRKSDNLAPVIGDGNCRVERCATGNISGWPRPPPSPHAENLCQESSRLILATLSLGEKSCLPPISRELWRGFLTGWCGDGWRWILAAHRPGIPLKNLSSRGEEARAGKLLGPHGFSGAWHSTGLWPDSSDQSQPADRIDDKWRKTWTEQMTKTF